MQYVVTVMEHRVPQADLVFFLLDAEAVFQIDGVLSTDGNAACSETKFFKDDGARPFLDWNILRTRNCYSKEYKRRKCAEVLVPDRVPVECMRQICVYEPSVVTRLGVLIRELRKLHNLRQQRVPAIVPDRSLYY